jgi:ketosteroid isomerase-like protein
VVSVASPNVEVVLSIYATWDVDLRTAEWVHPEIEFGWADGPTAGIWRGRDEAAKAWQDFLENWEEYRVEVEDYRELEDERVLVLTRRSGHGKTSGLDLGQLRPEGAALYHLRGGKVARVLFYFDREVAFADLGLASEADSMRSQS